MLSATSRPRVLFRKGCAIAAAATLLLVAPLSAQASTKTLARSLSNIVFAPFDIVLSPVSAGKGMTGKLMDIDDTLGVRIAYTIPGYFWYATVICGGAVVRGMTGLLQFPASVALLASETDLDAWMDPVDRAPALVEFDFELFPIKFGIDFTSAEY